MTRTGGSFVGLDVGSRGVKAVLSEAGRITRYAEADTVAFYRALACGAEPFEHIPLAGASYFVTGYGRLSETMEGAADSYDEMTAHRAGVSHLVGLSDYILLDIGGQDTKLMSVRSGLVEDLEANDRCAASSGRFIENIAVLLDVPLADFLATAAEPVDLSSTCAVFAESEVIEAVARGASSLSIAAGVLEAVYHRIEPMLLRMGEGPVVFTGGLSASPALRSIISRKSGHEVISPPGARHAGAIGCLVLAGALHPDTCQPSANQSPADRPSADGPAADGPRADGIPADTPTADIPPARKEVLACTD